MNLITARPPPEKRVGTHEGDHELHMTEAAVMLAMAEWLFSLGAADVAMHPDGMHMKGFDIPLALTSAGFLRTSTTGSRGVSGSFRRGHQQLMVHSQPGLGDIIAEVNGVHIEVEAKGGCVNSRHPGQVSRLRKGLHEAVGQLMGSPRLETRLIAAVPYHKETAKLAGRLSPRCKLASIEIALVNEDGTVAFV